MTAAAARHAFSGNAAPGNAVLRRRQRGMSLVMAVFLIAVVASLAAFAVTAGASQGQSTNLQLTADRATAAARAGLEWGAYRALVQTSCPGPANPTVVPLNEAALRGFRVTVTCRSLHPDGPLFEITAFAQNGNFGGVSYASRRLVSRF
jgi:MSHA biogenesis protein MshP